MSCRTCRLTNGFAKGCAVLALLVLLSALFGPARPCRADAPSAGQALEHRVAAIKRDTQAARDSLAAEQARIKGELDELRLAVREQEALLEQRKALFEELEERERRAREDLASQEQDLSRMENAALDTARDFEALLLSSPAGALAPERVAACRALLDADGLPRFEDIRQLALVLLEQVRDSGTVRAATLPVLGTDGTASRKAVAVMGENAAFCMDGSEVRGLNLLRGGHFSVSGAALPGDTEEALRSALAQAGKSLAASGPRASIAQAEPAASPVPEALPRKLVNPELLVVDLSEGAWFAADTSTPGLIERLGSGGFLVWPILLVGRAGIAIGLERLVLLTRVKRASSGLLERLEDLLRSGRADECRTLCRAAGDAPACRVMEAGLDHAGAPRDVLENVFHDAILKEVPRLERFLPTLSVLGAVAPLLGLLGTVTGMINTFGMMTLFGNSDPKLMSGGISEALITTQLGLAVAIPVLLLHHFLERRVDRIVADMEEKSVAFSVTLLGPERRA